MSVRKIETVTSIKELELDSKSASTLAVHGYDVSVVITAARCGKLKKLNSVGAKRAEMIFEAVDRAGFIMHESKMSSGLRKLLATAFGYPLGTPEEYEARVEFTEQQKKALFELVDNFTEQEIAVMTLRFGLEETEPMNLEQVAAMMSVSRERIRQVEAKAMRKLRHPRHRNKLKELFPDWPGFPELEPENEKMETQYDGPTEEMPLEELHDLSVRAYYQLMRAGICTVGQLTQLTYAEVRKIRNMTVSGVENIVTSLAKIGCELKAEEPDT